MTGDLRRLTEIFRKLGAPDPEGWARSQLTEGINQLHRILFLKKAWEAIIDEDDLSWIDSSIAQAAERPDEPFAGVGHALSRLVRNGAAPEDIATVVRGMQAQLLFSFCYLLEDPGIVDEEVENVGWQLVESDDDFEPTDRPISGLHESVLETDPTGREMRPKPARH